MSGDQRPDRTWFAPNPQRVGITTASGHVTSRQINSAKPTNSLLVTNTDQQGPIEILIDNGTGIELWTFLDCNLTPITGPDNQPYLLDTGYRGTGTTCTDLDNNRHRDLVALNLQNTTTTNHYQLTQTIIQLHNTTATNGPTQQTTIQATPQQTTQYYGIHCGPLTLTPEMLTP